MSKSILFLLVASSISACSGSSSNKNGVPNKDEARTIVKNWFATKDEHNTGTASQMESFDIVSVTGDSKLTIISFKWSGLSYPPSIPNTDLTPRKVKDKPEKMQAQNNDGKWEVLVVEDQ